jgi:hypothetical protein
MNDILHRIGIDAPQDQVHRAVATPAGIASWWARDTTGDAGVGAKFQVSFGEGRDLTFEVVQDTADRVEWRCVEGPDEWQMTPFVFELEQTPDETILLFSQRDWPAGSTPFQAHCSTKWGVFLVGIKAMLEGGAATPYPGELQISSWS